MEFVAPQFFHWFSYVDFSEGTIHLFMQQFFCIEHYPQRIDILDAVCSYFKVREAILYQSHEFLRGFSAELIAYDKAPE